MYQIPITKIPNMIRQKSAKNPEQKLPMVYQKSVIPKNPATQQKY